VCVCMSVCRFIYETEQFNGIGELLEILGRSVSLSVSTLNLYRAISQSISIVLSTLVGLSSKN